MCIRDRVVPLPENIALLEFGLSTRYSPCAYDYSGNAFTWAAEDLSLIHIYGTAASTTIPAAPPRASSL